MPARRQGVDAAGSEVQILTDPELRRERANIEAALTKSEWWFGPVRRRVVRINPSTLVSAPGSWA
jgi:hypothetical protein